MDNPLLWGHHGWSPAWTGETQRITLSRVDPRLSGGDSFENDMLRAHRGGSPPKRGRRRGVGEAD